MTYRPDFDAWMNEWRAEQDAERMADPICDKCGEPESEHSSTGDCPEGSC